jgi:hypothetical protein
MRLPIDIMHKIADYLAPGDLFNFTMLNSDTNMAVSKRQKDTMRLWNSIFQSYDWVDTLHSLGFTPVLISLDTNPLYIYLFFARLQHDTGPFAKQEILKSKECIERYFRRHRRGAKLYEAEFANITINISDLLFPGAPILVKGLEWASEGKKVKVFVYGSTMCLVSPESCLGYGLVNIPELSLASWKVGETAKN